MNLSWFSDMSFFSAVSWEIPLFVSAFISATLFPGASEGVLVAAILNGESPAAALVSATSGNTLGAMTTYLIGRMGSEALLRRFGPDGCVRKRGEAWMARYGIWTLLLSWLPVVGDPLCLLAGLGRLAPVPSLFLILVGKAVRYGFIIWLTLRGMAVLP